MKVTVELSGQVMTEILELTGERKKDPAIRRLMEEALQQRRRAQIAQRFLSGEWGVELETYEADQERERLRAQEIAGCLCCSTPASGSTSPGPAARLPVWRNRCAARCSVRPGRRKPDSWRLSSTPCLERG
jgi:hypothetical protein